MRIPLPNNTFTWQSITAHSSPGEIAAFCQDIFLDDKLEVTRCKRPHLYCKFRCDALISHIENVRNFGCYRDCLKTIQSVPVKKPAPEAFNWSWSPKIGDKCDYKPEGSQVYYACQVKGLMNEESEKKKFANIDYITSDGDKRSLHVNYPNSNFVPCGKGIPIRKDCKK